MKRKVASHRLLRIGALVPLPLFSVYDWLCSGISVPSLCLNVWCSLLLLLQYPAPHETLRPSVVAIIASLLFTAGLRLVAAPPWIIVSYGCLILTCLAFYRGARRFDDIQSMFLISTVWPGVLDYLGVLHMLPGILLGFCITVPLVENPAFGWPLLVLLSAFLILQYCRIYTRRTFFLSKRNEALVKSGQRNNACRLPVQYVDSDSGTARLFNEVLRILEVQKPYLQQSFSVEDLARLTQSNRLYVSKAINIHSGRNFNQLVNYYRVKHAVELLRSNSKIRMSDLALKSGFHSTVTFNMAFKLNEHTTPSEYVRNLKKIT